MKHRIENMGKLRLLGKVEKQQVDNVRADKFWERCAKDGTLEELLAFSTSINKEQIGVADGSSYDGESYFYYIATPFSDEKIPDGYGIKELPASLWVKFECADFSVEDTASQEMWSEIYSEFFPNSIYEPAEYQLEVYSNGEVNKGAEIWIAVKTKDVV